MRRYLTSIPTRGVWVATLATAISMTGGSAYAQKKPKKPAAAAPVEKPAPVDLDADSPTPPASTAATPGTKPKPAKVVDNSPPPQAGQMTEEAAQAKRLFDGEKWSEAALALYRVSHGETGDDEGNKQLAQYHLAISLYRLKFYQASYAIFSEIADKPNHLKFNETLLWLAKLATQLPEPADIIERVGKYNDEQIARFNNPQQRDLYWQLNYLLGRYKYRNRQYEEAIRLFEKVDTTSKYYVQAQFFTRHLVRAAPQVGARGQVVPAHRRRDRRGRRGRRGRGAHARPRVPLDGAHVLLGVGPPRREQRRRPSTRRSSPPRSSTGTRSTSRASTGSTRSSRSRGRTSWPATTRTRSATSTRSRRRTSRTRSTRRRTSSRPSSTSRTASTTTRPRSSRAFKKKYEPIHDELEQGPQALQGRGQRGAVLQVPEGRARRQGEPRRRASSPSSRTRSRDRQLLRNLEYVQRPRRGGRRASRRRPRSFQSSPLGNDVTDALKLARDLAVRNAGAARPRALPAQPRRAQRAPPRRREDPHRHHRRAAQPARRRRSQAARSPRPRVEGYGVVKPDEEHVLWPFDGEYWRDELGFYRQIDHLEVREVVMMNRVLSSRWPSSALSRRALVASLAGAASASRRRRRAADRVGGAASADDAYDRRSKTCPRRSEAVRRPARSAPQATSSRAAARRLEEEAISRTTSRTNPDATR